MGELIDLVVFLGLMIFATTSIAIRCVRAFRDLRIRQRRAQFRVIAGTGPHTDVAGRSNPRRHPRPRLHSADRTAAWEPAPLLQSQRPRGD
jgi:hypothetical protein